MINHSSILRSSNNKHTECNNQKPDTCFRCGSEHRFITNYQKPNTSEKKVHQNTENPKTRAYIQTKIYNTLDISTDQIKSQNIYAPISRMYSNAESSRKYFVDSSQQTSQILDSDATCHMTTEIQGFIPGSFVKYIYILKLRMGIFLQQKKQEKFK